jgi:hypothetical protein
VVVVGIGDEVDIRNTIRQELHPDLILELHAVVIHRNVTVVLVVLIDIDIPPYLANDLEIHLAVIILVYVRIRNPLRNSRKGDKQA